MDKQPSEPVTWDIRDDEIDCSGSAAAWKLGEELARHEAERIDTSMGDD